LKKILIYLIKQYQKIPFSSHSHCKYIPTCSNYAIAVLDDFGFFKGSFLTIKRLIKCSPFSKGGIDLPPKKEKK
jgi:putative membrane protein insertion efficiency factor